MRRQRVRFIRNERQPFLLDNDDHVIDSPDLNHVGTAGHDDDPRATHGAVR